MTSSMYLLAVGDRAQKPNDDRCRLRRTAELLRDSEKWPGDWRNHRRRKRQGDSAREDSGEKRPESRGLAGWLKVCPKCCLVFWDGMFVAWQVSTAWASRAVELLWRAWVLTETGCASGAHYSRPHLPRPRPRTTRRTAQTTRKNGTNRTTWMTREHPKPTRTNQNTRTTRDHQLDPGRSGDHSLGAISRTCRGSVVEVAEQIVVFLVTEQMVAVPVPQVRREICGGDSACAGGAHQRWSL